MRDLVLGVDVGAQAARVVVADTTGHVVADARQEFAEAAVPGLPPGYLEQNPDDWWDTTCACLHLVVSKLREQGRTTDEIVAAAVDSGSGTVGLLDGANRPLRPALRQEDQRAGAEAEEVNSAEEALRRKLSYHFAPSSSLPKILWLARHEPALWAKTRHIAHAADYVVGKLTGRFDISDPSHAHDTGFDLMDYRWPGSIERSLGIDRRRLPRVIRTGEPIANISKACAEETGLAPTTLIVAGMTDDLAAQMACGGRHVGDWNTDFGMTLRFKGLTTQLLRDAPERVSSYLHPLGYWMPRAESHVGAGILNRRFPKANQAVFRRAALRLCPTSLLVYPLAQKGERFPFDKPDAAGFILGRARSDRESYAAHLEGVAFVERLGYEMLRSLGAEMRERVYASSVGAESREWMQVRADVMGVELARAKNANAAMGSAIIAASRTLFADVTEASAQMVRIDQVIHPRAAIVTGYDETYRRFLAACRRRGYMDRQTIPKAVDEAS